MANNIDDIQFNPAEYISELVVPEDDEDYDNAKKRAEIVNLMYPSAYLARADFFGWANSMENQMRWIGANMIPNKERHVQQLRSKGISREDDLREYKFANEQMPHVNSEIDKDDLIAMGESILEDYRYSLRVCAISFVVAVREHDAISNTLDQLSYSAIKAKGEAKRNGTRQAPPVVKLDKI